VSGFRVQVVAENGPVYAAPSPHENPRLRYQPQGIAVSPTSMSAAALAAASASANATASSFSSLCLRESSVSRKRRRISRSAAFSSSSQDGSPRGVGACSSGGISKNSSKMVFSSAVSGRIASEIVGSWVGWRDQVEHGSSMVILAPCPPIFHVYETDKLTGRHGAPEYQGRTYRYHGIAAPPPLRRS